MQIMNIGNKSQEKEKFQNLSDFSFKKKSLIVIYKRINRLLNVQ